jgi:hypothetical protein
MKYVRVYAQIVAVVEADNFDTAEKEMLEAIEIAEKSVTGNKVVKVEHVGVDGMDEI